MKLFEENAQEIQKATETVTVENTAAYDQVVEFCITNGIKMNPDQINALKESFITEEEAPKSDNSVIKDEEFKTEENSRGDDPTIDMAKDDSAQNGKEPCPAHIEDQIEDEGKKNDEFVNDADEDTIKNEAANNTYVNMLETFVLNGVQMSEDQLDALKEEFLLEAKDPEVKSRKSFVKDLKKALQDIMKNEGIKMWIVEAPNVKAFVKSEANRFNLKFDFEPKGLRIATGIATAGATELGRALSSGTTVSRASQEAVSKFLEDCEDDVAAKVAEVGKKHGLEAELVRASINGFAIKAEGGATIEKEEKED